jgi:hypothetical protein
MAKKKKYGAKKINFYVEVEGRPRRLLSIIDQDEGSAQVFLFAGPHPGYVQTSRKITQNKYSIHATADKPDFNLIKRTSIINGDETYPAYCRISTVKDKKGFFAPVFQLNFLNFKSKDHDFSTSADGQSVCLHEYDPSTTSIVLGLYVGARNASFEFGSRDNITHYIVDTQNFRIVLLMLLFQIPAPVSGTTLERLTFLPEEGEAPSNATLFTGMPAAECVNEFFNFGQGFVNNIAYEHLTRSQDPEVIRLLTDFLAKREFLP